MFTFYKKCSIINIVLRGILDINNMRERERERERVLVDPRKAEKFSFFG